VLKAGRVVFAFTSGVMIFTRWTRRKSVKTNQPAGAPGTAMGTEEAAQADEVREQARRQILELGELLGHSSIQPTGDAAVPLQRALDAYEAAEKVLDRARDITDLAGALVLVHQGRDAFGAATAAVKGKEPPAPVPLCFFNPLHGTDRLAAIGAVARHSGPELQRMCEASQAASPARCPVLSRARP